MRTVLLLILAGLAAPAFASEDLTRCEFTGSWNDIEGRNPTILIVSQNQEQFDDDDSVIVAFFNEDWSIASGETLGRIKVENETGGWFDNDAIALKNGFMIWSEFDHIENVFGGVPKAMHVSRNGKTIDKLSLSGLFSDWISFRSCRDKKVSLKNESDRKAKLQREIPQDPFAK